jgi:hypothetical protein
VLQTRTFQRVGDTRERLFRGKLIAALKRLGAEGILISKIERLMP